MKNLPLAALCLFLVILGCSAPRTENPTPPPKPKSERIVANMDVKDSKARFLGEALAYVNNLVMADEAMVKEFQNDSRTAQSILAAIKTAHETETKDFQTIEMPPKMYAAILQRIKKVHDDHTRAYTEYARTFSMPNQKKMEESIDRGNKLIKRSMLKEMSEIKDMVSAAMERDVAH